MQTRYAVAMAMALSACSPAAVEAPQAEQGAVTEEAAFTAALDANNRAAYAAFLERHPDSVYADLAIDLMTEAGIRNDQAAPNSVAAARSAVRSAAAPATATATPITASATIETPSTDAGARDPVLRGQ